MFKLIKMMPGLSRERERERGRERRKGRGRHIEKILIKRRKKKKIIHVRGERKREIERENNLTS